MDADTRERKRYAIRFAVLAGLLVLALALNIDDWRRDLVTNHAEISQTSSDPALRPFVSVASTQELVEAIHGAARRIGSWEYVGDAREGDTTLLVFVRRSKVLRLENDVTLRIRDAEGRRIVTGESRSRIGIGDLGQNPRNLRRILEELQVVLQGARKGRSP